MPSNNAKLPKESKMNRSEFNANEALATSKIRVNYTPLKTTKTQKAFPWINLGLWLMVLPLVAKFAS